MTRSRSTVQWVFAAVVASGCVPSDRVHQLDDRRIARSDVAAPPIEGVAMEATELRTIVRGGSKEGRVRFERSRQALDAAVERLVRRSYDAKLWLDHVPSSNSHRLLICGNACRTLDGTESLVEWWAGDLTQKKLHQLHRGEFVAVVSSAGLSPTHRVRVAGREGDRATVEDILKDRLTESLVEHPQPWNERERGRGIEHGWLLQAACRYHGASMGLDSKQGEELLRRTIESATRGATEAGAHELEGLAICLNAHAREPATELVDPYTSVSRALADSRASVLSKMNDDGQLYVDDPRFDDCAGEVCDVLADLSRQAHFFEWSAVGPSVELDEEMLRALSRLNELATKAASLLDAELDEAPDPRMWFPLFASASSHTAHVAQHLQRWQP